MWIYAPINWASESWEPMRSPPSWLLQPMIGWINCSFKMWTNHVWVIQIRTYFDWLERNVKPFHPEGARLPRCSDIDLGDEYTGEWEDTAFVRICSFTSSLVCLVAADMRGLSFVWISLFAFVCLLVFVCLFVCLFVWIIVCLFVCISLHIFLFSFYLIFSFLSMDLSLSFSSIPTPLRAPQRLTFVELPGHWAPRDWSDLGDT